MKRILLGILMICVSVQLFAAADYSEKMQGVTVLFRDGKSEKVKLNEYKAGNVVIVRTGSNGHLEGVKIPKADVNALSFDGKDYGDRFAVGDEGFVMADGRVLKGTLDGLDTSTFWRRISEAGRTERLDRDEVVFIQFRKAAQAVPDQPQKPLQKSTIEVSSKQAWTVTNIHLKKGQRVYFTVNPARPITCAGITNVNADGVNPFTADMKRPLGNEKACALIGKIGLDVFRVGTNETPFNVKADGELLLGINDYRFVTNGGMFSVMIVVEQ